MLLAADHGGEGNLVRIHENALISLVIFSGPRWRTSGGGGGEADADVDADAAGNVHACDVIHPEDSATRRDICYNHKAVGAAWEPTAQVRISTSDTPNQLPAIAVDAQGADHVVWSSQGEGVPGDIFYRKVVPEVALLGPGRLGRRGLVGGRGALGGCRCVGWRRALGRRRSGGRRRGSLPLRW